jgi:hypothetical protein
VSSLRAAVGEVICGEFLLVSEEQVLAATPYVRLTLADASGCVTGLVSQQCWDAADRLTVGVPVRLRALVSQHGGAPGLEVQRIALLPAERASGATDLMPGIPEPSRSQLHELEISLRPPLRQFLARVLLDPRIGPLFVRCRASADNHHNEIGGLLRHSLENLHAMTAVVASSPAGDAVSAELVRLGYFLHDVGKIRTVGAERRPRDYHIARHETHNLLVLAPHLDWLRKVDHGAWAGLTNILEFIATPSAERGRGRYFAAEVVTMFDQMSAAAHGRRNLDSLLASIPRTRPHRSHSGRWRGAA